MVSYRPSATRYVSCQMPTSPEVPTRRLNFFHAAWCGRLASEAKRSRCSVLRQYCTSSGPVSETQVWKPSRPRSLRWDSTRSIGAMALATGHHLCSFQGLLIRMPIRKTTKSPSRSAVIRAGITFAILFRLWIVPLSTTDSCTIHYDGEERNHADGRAEQAQRGVGTDDQVLPAGGPAAGGYRDRSQPGRLRRRAPAPAARHPRADRRRRRVGDRRPRGARG